MPTNNKSDESSVAKTSPEESKKDIRVIANADAKTIQDKCNLLNNIFTYLDHLSQSLWGPTAGEFNELFKSEIENFLKAAGMARINYDMPDYELACLNFSKEIINKLIKDISEKESQLAQTSSLLKSHQLEITSGKQFIELHTILNNYAKHYGDDALQSNVREIYEEHKKLLNQSDEMLVDVLTNTIVELSALQDEMQADFDNKIKCIDPLGNGILAHQSIVMSEAIKSKGLLDRNIAAVATVAQQELGVAKRQQLIETKLEIKALTNTLQTAYLKDIKKMSPSNVVQFNKLMQIRYKPGEAYMQQVKEELKNFNSKRIYHNNPNTFNIPKANMAVNFEIQLQQLNFLIAKKEKTLHKQNGFFAKLFENKKEKNQRINQSYQLGLLKHIVKEITENSASLSEDTLRKMIQYAMNENKKFAQWNNGTASDAEFDNELMSLLKVDDSKDRKIKHGLNIKN